MDTVIRRCTTRDAATIASLGARLFVQAYGPTHPEPELSPYLARSYSVQVMAKIIAEDGDIFVIEDSAGTPIGYAHLRATLELPAGVHGQHAFEIVRFYVDSSWQGRGVGAALMKYCCAIAKDAGADVIWLQVWSQAPWAIGFYQRVGFAIVGKKNFYFGERVDEDHVMSLAL